MFSTVFLLATLGVFAHLDTFTHGCQLPSEWRPLSESCRAELAEIIVYAKVLAIHREPLGVGTGSLYNSLPFGFGYGYEGAEEGLLYSAEVELLCDQAWGSMLEVPSGSRLNLTGLGYLSCHSHTVMENYSYFFFLRMDENYSILPHSVNFQDAIFPDTPENRRTFSSLFQFSNCTQGSQPFHTFSPEWDIQEDNRLLCSSVQMALFDEEERGRKLQDRLAAAERRNRQLKERVRKVKRSLRNARKAARKAEQEAQELQEKLKAAERRLGLHLNAITQEEPPLGGYTSAAIRQRIQL
ncbi:coiled-coil domain-containing protein 3a isoform X1 [Melanotaenia boesemani]|uniref:coiled-coil domain-containing protein 3a isoform X1 n=1 Tax=Melanotaenia boesemani TaxID=1250792 RepID=UPI001C048209|nr:coiled-coil domain-containing protein 3a isoform X1 [Melanotaenia boesemani]XP_041833761.1 coiled-coil domain-containing protein 3a isoform X1 [Melanotaenia boesemani]